MDLAILPYFVYAIMSKVTRAHVRIAYAAILPATIVCMVALSYVDGARVQQLVTDEIRLENEYRTENSVTAQAYTVFLQKNPLTLMDVKNVSAALTKSNETVQRMFGIIEQMRIENDKKLPSVNKEKVSTHLDNYEAFLNLNKQQADEMLQLMSYVSSINPGNLNATQVEKINEYEKNINNFSTLISDASTRMSEEKNY
jgi:NADH dehydrogenase/NADH:ubiquinone oxidoreductase subunit G